MTRRARWMLTLTATPQIIAHERRNANGSTGRAWEISETDCAVLRAMVKAGEASTYQRRGPGGVALMAWDPKAVAKTATDAITARVQAAANVRRREQGMPIRVYKPPARWIAGRTHAPYYGGPAAWG